LDIIIIIIIIIICFIICICLATDIIALTIRIMYASSVEFHILSGDASMLVWVPSQVEPPNNIFLVHRL
jgi:hypothetical protein